MKGIEISKGRGTRARKSGGRWAGKEGGPCRAWEVGSGAAVGGDTLDRRGWDRSLPPQPWSAHLCRSSPASSPPPPRHRAPLSPEKAPGGRRRSGAAEASEQKGASPGWGEEGRQPLAPEAAGGSPWPPAGVNWGRRGRGPAGTSPGHVSPWAQVTNDALMMPALGLIIALPRITGRGTRGTTDTWGPGGAGPGWHVGLGGGAVCPEAPSSSPGGRSLQDAGRGRGLSPVRDPGFPKFLSR